MKSKIIDGKIQIKCCNPDCNHYYSVVGAFIDRKEKKITLPLICFECASVNVLIYPIFENMEIQEDYPVLKNSYKNTLDCKIKEINNKNTKVVNLTDFVKNKKR